MKKWFWTSASSQGKIAATNMAFKQWHKTQWNGDKGREGWFNTNRDMAYSSEHKTAIIIWNSDYGDIIASFQEGLYDASLNPCHVLDIYPYRALYHCALCLW